MSLDFAMEVSVWLDLTIGSSVSQKPIPLRGPPPIIQLSLSFARAVKTGQDCNGHYSRVAFRGWNGFGPASASGGVLR